MLADNAGGGRGGGEEEERRISGLKRLELKRLRRPS
jgi:hypothetical protein